MTKHRTAEERKHQILQAAMACFAEKGFYETTMDDVVERANLSKGSLYWYFKGKKELFQSLLEWWLAEFLESTQATLRDTDSATVKLRRIFGSIAENAMARPELLRAQFEFYAMASRDDDFREWIRAMYYANKDMLEGLLTDGIEEGVFRRMDVDAVARLIMAYLDGAFLHREIVESTDSIEQSLAEMADTILGLLEPA